MAARTGVKEEAQPGSTLLVIHNFAARSGDELTLAKGDRIELIERDDEFGDGWFLGKHIANGQTGLFPQVYTTLAPKSTPLNAIQPRRESEGLPSIPQSTAEKMPASPTQQRHSSTSAVPVTRTSAASADKIAPTPAPTVQPAFRTSLPPTSAPRTDPIPASSPITSPVMNETLSVIDEHMNDMGTPPASIMNSKRNSSGIGYSYIAGQETDDEENPLHTEDEVMAWSPQRVAEYLEDSGVETAHCDVFKEQEISGEVLLAMEQSSLFLKEFALGSVGRRLKTWHKIRALQSEVRQGKKIESQKNSFEIPEEDEEDAMAGDAGRNRASTIGAVPRALDTSRQSTTATAANDTLQPPASASGAVSPLQNITSAVRPEDEWRASAQAMREKQITLRQSRRLSGMNGDANGGSLDTTMREGHRKQPSMDESWQPGQPQINGNAAASHSHTMSADAAPRLPQRESSLHSPSVPLTPYEELDREYYSSNEAVNGPAVSSKPEPRKAPTSNASTDISRNSSNRRSTLSGGFISSDLFRDSFSPSISQGIFGALNSVGSSIRSATSPQAKRKATLPSRDGGNPIVTKLDYSASSDALTSSPNPMTAIDGPVTQRSSTSPRLPFFSSQKPKVSGIRTTSDVVTKHERLSASPRKDDASSPARTGSTTPSTETQSLEFQKSDAHLRMSMAPGGTLAPPNQHRMKVKPKKATSAYTRGLEKKTPAEQILGSDYSGWMKKKSGSLMATWKPRLFILRGRRLSYYYSDMDTEEKGLIDISFHRVLPAHNETLTGIHAAVTGAAGSPSSPKDSVTQTHAQQDLEQKPVVGETNDGMFIFKLVPPKTGLSKGVNFTKPTVHYFAVNSRQEGRLWMAALMKATIDKDEDGMVTTTYNQKTISLAKARARRERPPALKDSDMEDRAELDGEDDSSGRGLGIDGLGEKPDTVGGAERAQDETSSMAPSTVATGLESFAEKETVVAAS